MSSDDGSLIKKITSFIASYKLPFVIGFLGLICLGYGLISSIFPFAEKNTQDIVFTAGNESKNVIEQVSAEVKIVVDINGAVTNPGVFTFDEKARLADGLEAAGGLSEEADKEFVAREFNLAMKLKDGMKIYIPAVGEGIGSAAVAGVSAIGNSGGVLGENTDLININTANQSELDTLPGVGKVTAGKIIDGRPYSSIEELLEKKIVKQSVYEDIKDQITVY